MRRCPLGRIQHQFSILARLRGFQSVYDLITLVPLWCFGIFCGARDAFLRDADMLQIRRFIVRDLAASRRNNHAGTC
jgi:hypothetical protein